MQAALWISKTGLSAQDTKLATISNNLANVSTTAFKRDRAIFEDLFYQIERQPGGQTSQNTELPTGLQVGTGVRTVATQKVFGSGTLQISEQPLDLAIDGRGFFEVVLPDGNTGYTRDGQFHLDSAGQLVNASGYALQPAITVPNNVTSVTIGEDGTVSATSAGANIPTQIGTITLTDFINPAGLQAIGGNVYVETASSGTPQAGTAAQNGYGSVKQGMLEASNVNVVEELVNMISTQRAYEMNSKVISTADQMLQFVGQNL